MSGNPLYSFGASDSGILSALDGILPETPRGQLRRDDAGLCNTPHEADLHADTGLFGAGPTDAELDRRLRDAPMPADLLDRLRRVTDE